MDEKEVKTDSLSKQMKKKEEITEVKTTMPKERKNSDGVISSKLPKKEKDHKEISSVRSKATKNNETACHGKQTQLRLKESDTARQKGKNKKNKTTRTTKDQVKPDKSQATLTQYFQVRRSERKPKRVAEKERRSDLEQQILSGEEDGLEIRVLEGKGRGIFSKTPLKRGDLVCEYAGDLISMEEAQKREKEYADNPAVGCYMYYFLYNGKKHCVDATKESGRLGRLLNHSKTNANVCTRLFPINNIPHLILVAAKDVDMNEELLYDYGDRSKSAVESHPWLKT